MKPFCGTIKNWQLHKLSESEFVFTGTVLEAPDSAEFEAGRHIVSSTIVNKKRSEGLLEVETLNSFYHLVGEAGDSLLKEKLKAKGFRSLRAIMHYLVGLH